MKRAYSVITIKAVDEDQRIITGIATTPAPDRVDDIVEPKGAEFKLPLPFLYQHDSEQPIGHVRKAKVTKDGIEVEIRLVKTDVPGTLKDRLDQAWQEIKLGLVRGLSIGFRALETARIEGTYAFRFIRWEWLELSAVTIPANAEATIQTIKSFDAEQRAASGQSRAASRKPPGVSGRSNSQAQGNGKMKTLAERIKAAETRREEVAARMAEIMEGADDEGRIKEIEDRKEYDSLADDLRTIDEDLGRWKALAAAQKTATPVDGSNPRRASESRDHDMRRRLASVKQADLPKGTRFARYAMAVAAGKGSMSDTLAYAARWDGQTPEVSDYIKAQAGTAGGGSGAWGSELVEPNTLASEFIELLMPKTVIGRIAGFDMVPFNVRIVEQTNGSTVNWVGEKAPKPVGELDFGEFTLGYNKIAGIVVVSDELVRLSTPNAEQKVRNDLTKQIVKFMDQQFLLTSVTATATRPAAVTVGATAIAASGLSADAFRFDLNAAMAPFDTNEIDTGSLHFVMRPATARGLSTLTNMLGQPEFPTLNPQGGTLMGYPVIVSNSSPSGQISLIVASEIAMADDGTVRLDASNQATLDMAGGAAPDFSLWQRNATALRAERWITYKKKRTHAVTIITGAAYAPQEPPSGSPGE